MGGDSHSSGRNECDNYHYAKLREIVFCEVRRKIKRKPDGIRGYLSNLRRICVEAKAEYLNLKGTSIKNCDNSIGFNQKPSMDVVTAYLHLFLLARRIVVENTDTTDIDLVFSYVVEAYVTSSTSQGKQQIYSLLQSKLSEGLPEGLLLAQSIYCAKVALASYNEKHGTEYKLVEPLASARLRECGIRFHCNFTASKLKKNGSLTAQPKLFFANFQSIGKRICDMHCCIIDPAKAEYMCCEDCPPDLAHCGKRLCCYSVAWKYLLNQKEYKARKNKVYAEIALDIFNNKHGTKYKLVKSLESNIVPVSFGVYKFHCNFKAKLENPDSSDDASPKLFFGDIVKSTILSEGECYILDDTEGLVDHCSICRQGIFHPAHYRIPATSRD